MSAGNIDAIRDWVDRYFYKKSEVNSFLIKLDSGLKAYILKINGVPNATVTITENAQTDPQSYEIDLNADGKYEYPFFFHSGSTITLVDDESPQHSATQVLSAYTYEITLT